MTRRAICFDLDGTLALSKQAVQPDMAETLADLLQVAEGLAVEQVLFVEYRAETVLDRDHADGESHRVQTDIVDEP